MDGFISVILKILAFLLSFIMAFIGLFRNSGGDPEDPTSSVTQSVTASAQPTQPTVPPTQPTVPGQTVETVDGNVSLNGGIILRYATDTFYQNGTEIKKTFSVSYTSGGRTYGNSVTFIKNSSGGYNLQSDSTINTILTTTNGYRADAGVTALKVDYTDTCAALFRAVAMAAYCDMDHYSPNASFSDAIRLFRISYSVAAENIAYQKNLSDESVCKGWKESPGHYSNIINNSMTLTGIGYAVGSDGATYYAQIFTG